LIAREGVLKFEHTLPIKIIKVFWI